MQLLELAKRINVELSGNDQIEITDVAPLDKADHGCVTFAADAIKLKSASESGYTNYAAIIVHPKLVDNPFLEGRNLLITSNPKLAFARAIEIFHAPPLKSTGISADLITGEGTNIGVDCSIHPRVVIGQNSIIGNRVTLHPGVVISDNVHIGDDSVIFANVSIYDNSEIGARCRIHSGTVIGSDGFSFIPDEQGRQFKLLQVGKVVIEDDVEIGANCCIDRAGFGETRLRRGSKFDNLIQIGHNVDIGEDTVVASLAGFSGGTKVGNSCIIAGQIGTNQHITIGDNTVITARTGVTKSVGSGKVMGGMMPAQDYQEWRKCQVLYSRLPELFQRLRKLERNL